MPVFSNQFGWIDDGGHVAFATGMLPFGAMAPDQIEAIPGPDHKPILLYKAWLDVLGKFPDYPAQTIGDCTSQGTGHAIDLALAVEIVRKRGPKEAYRSVCTEAAYGVGRAEANMLGSWGDGCYGSALIKGALKEGILYREDLGAQGAYDGSRARQWGRSGTPREYLAIMATRKLGGSCQVRTREDAYACLANGMPFTICSGVGFDTPRDQNGFCRRRGRWPHCMHVEGMRFDIPGVCVGQSWGPQQPSGPTALGQPSFSFWITLDDLDVVLSEGDSWAIMDVPHPPPIKRELPRILREAA